jgi:hypothetical protein
MATPIKRQRWTNIDGIGLLNGLGIWDSQYRNLKYVRKPFDTPIDLKSRILRELENPTDTTQQGLLNGLCNEFNLDPYNLQKKTIFELTYPPVPSGDSSVQDVWVYVNTSGIWHEILPQVWSDGYTVAKENGYGFTVWQNDRYNTIDGLKNFRYSQIIEVHDDQIPDNSKLKFVYYINTIDENFNSARQLYTDMDHPDDPLDIRFTYRIPQDTGPIRVYTLDDIPEDLKYEYYFDESTGEAKDFLYTIKNHIDRKYKHKWGEFVDNECIWDIAKYYGQGHIPSFYDAEVPPRYYGNILDSGYLATANTHTGGIESYSNALYFAGIEEDDSTVSKWNPRIYPGRFYLAGIPFYLFENCQTTNLNFTSGVASLPSGLCRQHHVIMAQSGYYETAWNDVYAYFDGKIYEDYSYPTGPDSITYYGYIFRNRPYVQTATGYELTLNYGEYAIDFDSNQILVGSGISDVIIIWDQIDVPSGILIDHDLNPMNEQYLTLDKYFMYFTLG